MIQPKRRITDLTTLNSTTTHQRARTQRAMLDMYNVRSIGAAEMHPHTVFTYPALSRRNTK